MSLAGADPNADVVGLGELAGKSNYLSGNDPTQWHTDIPTYAQVESRQVYAGIDMTYYGNQQQLEYDFSVAPGADPRAIALDFQGQTSMQVDAQGNLVLHTAGGDVVEHAPVVYQEINGAREAVSGAYVLQGDHQVGFQVGAYDPSQPLVIDPILLYATYFGGNQDDAGNAIAVDPDGDAYVTGFAESTNFPVTASTATQPAFNGYGTDAFVAKLDPGGAVRLVDIPGWQPGREPPHERARCLRRRDVLRWVSVRPERRDGGRRRPLRRRLRDGLHRLLPH